MIQDLLRDNWQLFLAINREAGRQPLLDRLMIIGAQDAIVLLPVLLLALWVALARWSPLYQTAADRGAGARLEHDRKLGQRVAVLTVVGVIFALALNLLLSLLLYEPRPFIAFPTVVHRLIAHPGDNSFPSDHEAVAGAVATALGLCLLFVTTAAVQIGPATAEGGRSAIALGRRFVPEFLVAALPFVGALVVLAWIGVARVYTGVHYPGDILAGALSGFVGAVAAVALGPVAEPILAPLIALAERWHLA